MLWSIDSCENRVSADQYHMTVPRAQVSTHWGRVFFEVFCWQITSFKWSQAQFYFFQWFIWNILCLCHYGPALLRFWFQTDLARENSASFLLIQARKTFSYHGQALVTLYVQFVCSDWSKFNTWVHVENLCSILKVVYFDNWRNCLFPLDVQMKYSCYQESSVIHGWFVYWVFGWEMHRVSKFGNPISDGIVFIFHLAWCLRGFKSLKQPVLGINFWVWFSVGPLRLRLTGPSANYWSLLSFLNLFWMHAICVCNFIFLELVAIERLL